MGRSIVERDREKRAMFFFTGLLCVLLLSGCGGDIQPGDYSGGLVLSVRGELLSAKIKEVPIEIVLAARHQYGMEVLGLWVRPVVRMETNRPLPHCWRP
jgi:hypothetical protein